MPREANEERKHNYEESIDYDSHYDEYRNGELQRDAGDYQREPVCAERGYIGRHSDEDHRDLRCEQEVASQPPKGGEVWKNRPKGRFFLHISKKSSTFARDFAI